VKTSTAQAVPSVTHSEDRNNKYFRNIGKYLHRVTTQKLAAQIFFKCLISTDISRKLCQGLQN
jgi:hypothetical protein